MYAWSGFILAVMTASICLIVFFLNKNADESEVKKRKWVLLVVFGFTNVVISTIFESKIIAVVMVVASLLNYYNYFFMKENDQKTKIIFIISHMFIITYEIVVELYFFALMDFIATLSIIGALIITQYFHQKSHHFHRRLKHKEKGMEGITCQVNSGKSED